MGNADDCGNVLFVHEYVHVLCPSFNACIVESYVMGISAPQYYVCSVLLPV